MRAHLQAQGIQSLLKLVLGWLDEAEFQRLAQEIDPILDLLGEELAIADQQVDDDPGAGREDVPFGGGFGQGDDGAHAVDGEDACMEPFFNIGRDVADEPEAGECEVFGAIPDERECRLDSSLRCDEGTVAVERCDVADDPGCLVPQLWRFLLSLVLQHPHEDGQHIRLGYSFDQTLVGMTEGAHQSPDHNGALDG